MTSGKSLSMEESAIWQQASLKAWERRWENDPQTLAPEVCLLAGAVIDDEWKGRVGVGGSFKGAWLAAGVRIVTKLDFTKL